MFEILNRTMDFFADAGAVPDLQPVWEYVATWITAVISGVSGLAAIWFMVNCFYIIWKIAGHNRRNEIEKKAQAMESLWHNFLLLLAVGAVSGISGVLAGVVFS